MKSIAISIFLCLMFCREGFAQNIKLNNLSKIEFIGSSPFWSDASLHVVEVLPEGDVWNSYQLVLYQQGPKPINDSVRKFVKAIPKKDLEQLLIYINKPDSVLKFERFNVSTNQLKQYIDTLQKDAKNSMSYRHSREDSLWVNLTAGQRAFFYKVIKSKQAVKDAGLMVLRPFDNVDLSYYGMIFTYKDKSKDTVYAHVNSSHLYHLPWHIKGKQSNDPRLTKLFESIMNHNDFDKNERRSMAWGIDLRLFTRWINTKISWDEYKIHHPSNYQSLGKTLSPVYGMGFFKSALLPFNIQLRIKYQAADTLNTTAINDCEKEIVDVYHAGGFFFDYIKAHPTTIAFVEDARQKNIEIAKAVYPNVLKFDQHKIKFVCTAANFYQGLDLDRRSGWLLLPDGTMILISCSDQLIKDGDKIFAGLPLAGNKSTGFFCLVFDRQGHKLAGNYSHININTK